jgi:hypothetical protein
MNVEAHYESLTKELEALRDRVRLGPRLCDPLGEEKCHPPEQGREQAWGCRSQRRHVSRGRSSGRNPQTAQFRCLPPTPMGATGEQRQGRAS